MSSSPAPGAGAPLVARRDLTFRHCLGHFVTGVAVASYDTDGLPRGLTVNSFTSVSLDPPLVLICLDRRSRAVGTLPGRSFAINMLTADQRELAWHFAGRPSVEPPAWRRIGDVPLLRESLAWLVCEPWSTHDAGDHVIVIGRVSAYGAADEAPLCFFRGELLDLPSRRHDAAMV